MKNTNKYLQQLFNQYLNGQLTKEEFLELLALLETANKDIIFKELISLWESSRSEQFLLPSEEWDNKMKQLMDETKNDKTEVKYTSHYHLSSWRKIAATLLVLVTIGGTFWFIQNAKDTKSEATIIANSKTVNDVLPGGNKAILMLADGSKIILDSAQNGTLALQGNTSIMKKNNQVVYDASLSNSGSKNISPSYNTIVTPRGGQYRVTLPDGSKVWLNAATSMTFPTLFIGKERRVKINGEAYFEVTKNAAQPFIVNVNDKAEVTVLGTHFNVGAYEDESVIKTTLLEGSVRMSPLLGHSKASPMSTFVKLVPGQQAQFSQNGVMSVAMVDTEDAVAWKEGFFRFNNTDMSMIIRQLNRWYNVNIQAEEGLNEKIVTGYISRDVNISKVLKMLEYTARIKYKIEGASITISY